MGVVAQTHQGLMINDYRSSPVAHPDTLASTKITASLVEPLLCRGRLLGVIGVDHETPGHVFTERDQATLRLFADQAAIAIENARLHEAAVRHGVQMEALLQSLETVTSGLELQTILDRILDAANRISGAPHVKVLLLDKATNALRPGALKGSAMPAVHSFPMGVSLSGLVAQRGEPLFLSDAQNEPRNVFAQRDRELGIVTYLGLPIKRGDEVLGVLTFNTTVPYRYSSEEMNLLTSLADQAAIAIEHARLYEEVMRHAATLEARVQERTRDLDDARKVAEAASRAKSEFLANMSHELRTPLNATLGFSQLLLEQREGRLSAKQARYCENIADAGRRLCDTIGDILTYVELDSGQLVLDLQTVSVEALVDAAMADAQAEAATKQIGLKGSVAPDLPALAVDPARMQHILRELLSNAIKFTPPGGSITMRARTVLGQPDDLAIGPSAPAPNCPIAGSPSCPPAEWLELAVTDTGIGLRPEDLLRLFGEFTQLESVYTKHHAGTGIGLILAKRLVELHGGTITASSRGDGQGSTFTIRLPLDGAEKREA